MSETVPMVQAQTARLKTPPGNMRGMSRAPSPPALVVAVAGWALASALVPAVRWYDALVKARR